MSQFGGRTLDLVAFVAPTGGQGPAPLQFPTSLTAGPQKGAQQFLNALVTRRGTVKSDPTFGTTLLRDVQASGASDGSTERARRAVNTAVAQALAWFKANEADMGDLLADERVTGAEVREVSVSGDSLAVTLRLRLASGGNTTYIEATTAVPRV